MDIRFSCLRRNVDLGHYPIIEEEFSPKMIMYQLIQPMTRMIGLILVAILILIGSRLEAKPAELVFTYWGSPFERRAVEKKTPKNSISSMQTSEFVLSIFRTQIMTLSY